LIRLPGGCTPEVKWIENKVSSKGRNTDATDRTDCFDWESRNTDGYDGGRRRSDYY
jgi:hypothetical protein